MTAPFRIQRPDEGALGGSEEFRQYLDRLLKMIPGEVVGVYMIGSGFLPEKNLPFAAGWVVVCLLLVILVRVYGTGDSSKGQKPQGLPVAIAALAFVIWIFWLGGPFELLNIPYRAQLASLAVLVWSFVIPLIYKGPRE